MFWVAGPRQYIAHGLQLNASGIARCFVWGHTQGPVTTQAQAEHPQDKGPAQGRGTPWEAVVRPHGWGDTSATLRTLARTIALNEADEGTPIALTGELLYDTVYALRTYSHHVPLRVRYTFTHAAAPAGQTHWETVEEEERELV